MWDYHANQIMLENKKYDCNHNQIIEQDRRSTAPNLGIVLSKSGKKSPTRSGTSAHPKLSKHLGSSLRF